MIIWKPPTLPCIKVNTDESLQNSNVACGEIFRDQSGVFMGCLSASFGDYSVLKAEIMGFIIAMEIVARHHWRFIWIEGDSIGVLLAFSKPSMIPIRWRNRWHSCFSHSMRAIFSHIFHEGNGCANELASHGHSVSDTVWWDVMYVFFRGYFFRDK